MTEAFPDDGIVENSGEFSKLTSADARARMTAKAKREGFGEKAITYRIEGLGRLAAALLGNADSGDPLPEMTASSRYPKISCRWCCRLNVEITGKGRSPLENVRSS